MKLRGAKKVHYDSGPNMTPLVDVVMVILIFLMLAGSFGGAEHFLVSQTAIAASGTGGNTSLVPKDVQLTITVDYTGPGRFIARLGDFSTTDMNALAAAMKKKKSQFNAAGTGTEKIQVIIAPGKLVEYRFLIDVYQAALQAEYTKVSFQHSH